MGWWSDRAADFRTGIAGTVDLFDEYVLNEPTHYAANVVAVQTAEQVIGSSGPMTAAQAAAVVLDQVEHREEQDAGGAVVHAAAEKTAKDLGGGLLTGLKAALWIGGAVVVVYLVDLGVRVAKVAK